MLKSKQICCRYWKDEMIKGSFIEILAEGELKTGGRKKYDKL